MRKHKETEKLFKSLDALTESEGFKKLCVELKVPDNMIKIKLKDLKESPRMALALFYALTREI